MTAAELVKKQSRQLRTDAHVQADRRANRRDFDLRYGNHKRPPYGTVKRSTYKRQPRRESYWSAATDLGLLIGAGCAALLLIAVLR